LGRHCCGTNPELQRTNFSKKKPLVTAADADTGIGDTCFELSDNGADSAIAYCICHKG
jgi:hypothetical protein